MQSTRKRKFRDHTSDQGRAELRKLVQRETKYDSKIDLVHSGTTFDFAVHKPFGDSSVFCDEVSQTVSDSAADLKMIYLSQNVLFETYSLIYTAVSREHNPFEFNFPLSPVVVMFDVLFHSDVSVGAVAGGLTILRMEISPRERAILFGDDFEDPRRNSPVDLFLSEFRPFDLIARPGDEDYEVKLRLLIKTRLRILRMTPFELLRLLLTCSLEDLTFLGVPVHQPHFSMFFANRHTWCSAARSYSCQDSDISLTSPFVSEVFSEYNALVLFWKYIRNKAVVCDEKGSVISTGLQFMNILMNVNTDRTVADLEDKLKQMYKANQVIMDKMFMDEKVNDLEYNIVASDILSTIEEIARATADLRTSLATRVPKQFYYSKLTSLVHVYSDATFGRGNLENMPRYQACTRSVNSAFLHQETTEFAKRVASRFSEMGCRNFQTDAKSLETREQITVSMCRTAIQMMRDDFPGHDSSFIEELKRYYEDFKPVLFDQLDVPSTVASSTRFGLSALDQWLLHLHKKGFSPEQVMLDLAAFVSPAKEGNEERTVVIIQGPPSTGKTVSMRRIVKNYMGDESNMAASGTEGAVANPSSKMFDSLCSDEDMKHVRNVHRTDMDIIKTRGDDSQLLVTEQTSISKSATTTQQGRRAAARVTTERNGEKIEQWRAQTQAAIVRTNMILAVNSHPRCQDPALFFRCMSIPFPSSSVDYYKHFEYAIKVVSPSDDSAQDRKKYVVFCLAAYLRSCGLAKVAVSPFALAQLSRMLERSAEPGNVDGDWLTAQSNPRDTSDVDRFIKLQMGKNWDDAKRLINNRRSYIDNFSINKSVRDDEFLSRVETFLDEVADKMVSKLPLPSFARCKKNGPVIDTRDVMRIITLTQTYSFFSAFISAFYGNVVGRSYTTNDPFFAAFQKIPFIYQLETQHVLKIASQIDLFDRRTVDSARGLQMLVVQWCLSNSIEFDVNRKCFVLRQFFSGKKAGEDRAFHLNDMISRYFPCSRWKNSDSSITVAQLTRVCTIEYNKFTHPILDWADILTEESTSLKINFAVFFLPSYLKRLFDSTFVYSDRPLHTLTFGVKTNDKGASSLEMVTFEPRTYDMKGREHPLADPAEDLEKVFETRRVPRAEVGEGEPNDLLRTALISRVMAADEVVVSLFFSLVASQGDAPLESNGNQGVVQTAIDLVNSYKSLLSYPDEALIQTIKTRLEDRRRQSMNLKDRLYSSAPSLERDFVFEDDDIRTTRMDSLDVETVPACFSSEKRWLQDYLASQAESGTTIYSRSSLRDAPLLLRGDYSTMERCYSVHKICEQIGGDVKCEARLHCLHPNNISLSWHYDANIQAMAAFLVPVFTFACCEIIDGQLYHSWRAGNTTCQPTRVFVKIFCSLSDYLFEFLFWKSTLHGMASHVNEAFCLFESERLGVRCCKSLVIAIARILADPKITNKRQAFADARNEWTLTRFATTDQMRTEILNSMSRQERTDITGKLHALQFFNPLESLMFIPREEDLPFTREELQQKYIVSQELEPVSQ